jgi:predicted AlkP superfamily pyrophosphatase or phosphodiesterase
MINEESVQVVNASRFNEFFRKPLDTYSFAQIPNTLRALLTGDPQEGGLPEKALAHFPRRYDKVILLFVDAFGWRFLQRYYDQYPFLGRIVNEGVISKLTAQFPSTTTAHVTTIHTGLPVGASGLYEWFIYEPTLDEIIAPLLFSYAGDKERNTLQHTPINARTLYPRQTLYQEWQTQGIKSYILQHRDYAFSPFGEVVFDGARVLPYRTISEALVNLTTLALGEKERAYYFLYYEGIDTVSHIYGPESPQVAAEIDTFLMALERIIHANLAGKLKNTLLLITADHGQVEVNPETTVFLNQTLPTLEPYLKTNRKGRPLVPAGSARDMFLHIIPRYMDDAQASLQRHLEGRAEIYRVNTLIEQGFFGASVSSRFLERVGDLVILPYRYESVWWYEKGIFDHRFMGHHGGLTPEEMETILLVQPYL